MLQFILGRAGSGKTTALRQMLADQSRAGRDKLILLVPEQYTFETEKAMLALCGARRANRIRVFSFPRLAETVFREEGGAAGRRLSDGGRRILMSLALLQCEDQLEVYARAAQTGRVTDLMLSAVNEMKLCGVAPAQLTQTAALLGDSALGKKLSEIGLAYGAFEALVSASYLDSRDDLTRLADHLSDSDFFRGATVAVDSFEGFTAPEMAILGDMLQKADSVTVALCTDGSPQGETGLFALVERTRSRLSRLAKELGVPEAPPVFQTGAPRYHQENLKLLEAQLFTPGELLTSPDAQGLRIFSARDPFQEAEYVASSIRRLVEERGWRYRDFSILCRDPRDYYGSLDVALARRGIPCFLSQPEQVDAKPVMRFVLGAFEAVQSGFATNDLLELLKTGLSGFTPREISDLENYAFLWKIQRRAWREPFLRHPGGFGREMTPDDEAELARLNDLRTRLVRPLTRFADATRDASGAQISEAVFRLLEDFGVEDTLPAACAALEAAGQPGLAAKEIRVWDLLMELLDQFHSLLGDRKCPRDRYYRLLREVVSREDISDVPQTTDQVLFGTPEQVLQASPKAVFLLGVSQGLFPLSPKAEGVFSDAERRRLLELELPLGDPLEQQAIRERYMAYSAACAPSELLVLSWPRRAGNEDREPSELIAAVREIFPTLAVTRDLPDETFADTREAAFSYMAAHYRENTPQAAAFRSLFEGREEYAGRLEALARAAGQKPARLEDPALAARLFGGSRTLSPTQIETYHSCPFKYFCRYGLGAKERRPAEVDVMQYGTLMHYLFEQIFRRDSAAPADPDDAGLEDRVRQLILTYARENMGGFDLLSGRERYRLDRLARSACRLIRHVRRELAQSRFTPEYFELGLGEDPSFPPLKIEDGAGNLVTVGGTIDRADTFTAADGRRYIRVIDYKTGHKVFRLADVLYGLNMQMLVYLAALVESGQRCPAGILYMPAAEPEVPGDRGDSPRELEEAAEKQLRMSGLVLEDEEIIRAMEDGAKGKFIPASLKKDGGLGRGSSALGEEDLRRVLEHSKRLIASMSRALREGRVAADPTMVNQNDCRFCPYGSVCGKEYSDKDVRQDRSSPETVLAKMTGEEDDPRG